MGLKLNFSTNEANSKPREVPPSGEYHCKIVDVEYREVAPGKQNSGKPFWAVRFVIQDGDYAGNSIYSNIMLFTGVDGTLSSLAQFLKAVGYDVYAGEVEIPDPDELMGKSLNIRGTKKPAGYDAKAKRDLQERFNVTGYKPANVAVKTGNTSLLP